MGGDGPWAVALMWLFSGLTFVFVVLRMYTRGAVIQNIGIDDHVYNFAFVSQSHSTALKSNRTLGPD